ncbi:MAG: FtsW/RodA/SpoVE family cell cycle protein [Bacteroidales bacterium]|nr:FtsW/RodA/SpoVE family cell cycle protein [Bacteroidales bacterium]MDD3009858.1 FtsW/RodA/SpoVE family cell cycle protein [Bacteroidales bacterium]MDD3960926.1 FtsW/RodA/SpoVE family cell cycle protein [Bacteroidales bacterium]HPE85701.1 FtsW/RodA/SpoVE family cell cycle protein [Bacteroidales bacterium]
MNFRLNKHHKILYLSIGLMLISMLAVYSSIGNLAHDKNGGNTFAYFFKHSTILLFGVFIMLGVEKVNIIKYPRLAQIIFVIGIVALIATLFFGLELNDAKRVLPLGFGLTFQASDIAKIGLIMYLSRKLVQVKEQIRSFKKGILPLLIPTLITCALIAPSNLSTALMLFIIAMVMMFFGRAKFIHLLGIAGVGLFLLVIMFTIGKYSPGAIPRLATWEHRIESHLSGEEESEGNYQKLQSQIAIASGWPMGKFFGNSTQRNFLPQSYNDFIYAITIEQTGPLGAIVILILYLAILGQSVKAALQTHSLFGKFLILGIGFSIVFQALINMMVATGLLPVTGQPLPLISMGGTSIWMTCFAIGMVLSIIKHNALNNLNTATDEP